MGILLLYYEQLHITNMYTALSPFFCNTKLCTKLYNETSFVPRRMQLAKADNNEDRCEHLK
jgi:hypothetical protein